MPFSNLYLSFTNIAHAIDSLKIGDFVTLRDPTFNIFLGVEGILNEDVFGMEEISNIHDAIFCVHLQRQYSASRELHSFLQRHGNDPRSITDENEINYLKALEVQFIFRFQLRTRNCFNTLIISREEEITKTR